MQQLINTTTLVCGRYPPTVGPSRHGQAHNFASLCKFVMCAVLLRWLGAQAYACITTKCVSCVVASHCQTPKLSLISLQGEQADLAPLGAALGRHYVCEQVEVASNSHTATTSLPHHHATNEAWYIKNTTLMECPLVCERKQWSNAIGSTWSNLAYRGLHK